MIKDILVHIPTERAMRPVIDASISLAKIFGAHLDAVALGYVSTGNVASPFTEVRLLPLPLISRETH